MSRIGNTPVRIPKDVTANVDGADSVTIRGPKGELKLRAPLGITFHISRDTIDVDANASAKKIKALHGLFRSLLANAMIGVSQGWTKTLELKGVGYRASLTDLNLVLMVGFSHPVTIVPPPGITFQTSEGKITVTGIDKQLVGQVAASVRLVKKPEPYKGKGIRYEGEHVRKKAGKAKVIGGTPGAAK